MCTGHARMSTSLMGRPDRFTVAAHDCAITQTHRPRTYRTPSLTILGILRPAATCSFQRIHSHSRYFPRGGQAVEGRAAGWLDSAEQQCRKTKFLLGQAAAGIRSQMGTSMLLRSSLRSRPGGGIRYVPRGIACTCGMQLLQPQSASRRGTRRRPVRPCTWHEGGPSARMQQLFVATQGDMLDSPICVRCFHSWPTCWLVRRSLIHRRRVPGQGRDALGRRQGVGWGRVCRREHC